MVCTVKEVPGTGIIHVEQVNLPRVSSLAMRKDKDKDVRRYNRCTFLPSVPSLLSVFFCMIMLNTAVSIHPSLTRLDLIHPFNVTSHQAKHERACLGLFSICPQYRTMVAERCAARLLCGGGYILHDLS